MPSSYPHNIPAIVQVMLDLRPASMLDIGPGYGKYGFLAREYVDDFRGEMRIDAVEVFPDYLRRVGWSPYDEVLHVNLLEVDLHRHYDLVLMIDVLEHFDRPDGYDAIYRATSAGDAVLISTPIGYEQGASHGNEHEAHLSEWHPDDLTSHGLTWEDVASDELSWVGLVR